MVLELCAQVQQVDGGRQDGLDPCATPHASLHGGGKPGSPAPLGAPGDDEVVDARRLGPHTARIGGKVLDTVHGPDHGLGHG